MGVHVQNDLLSWLIDGARASGEEVTVEDISSRMLFVSFGAIHTSSMVRIFILS